MSKDIDSLTFEDLTEEQQSIMISWLQENFIPIESINYRHSNFGLKQKFSRLVFYVTEKQFNEAMIKAGFKSKIKSETDKYSFNISQKSKFFNR